MKKLFQNKAILLLIILVMITFVLPTHFIHAQVAGAAAALAASVAPGVASSVGGVLTSIVGGAISISFNMALTILGYLVYGILTAAAFGLAIAAAILNVSLALTTNLGPFINSTPAIYDVWKVLRDISTLFLIFAILWAAIQTILNVQSAGYASLLRNIVIVGILINFSFFFTRVFIDFSNIISLQLYNAIAPSATVVDCTKNAQVDASYLTCMTGAIIGNGQGGLADVIVQNVSINQWYAKKDQLKDTGGNKADSTNNTLIRILLINVAGIVVVVIAALSLIAAAAAAIWRICVLLLLLATSPLWIVGNVLPKIKSEVSDKWVSHLKANLLFLPIYLLLMYVVIKIIQTLHLSSLGTNAAANAIAATGAQSYAALLPYLQLAVGFAIIIIMINLPLGIAISVSGASGTLLEKISKYARGWVARKTVGRAATWADDRLARTAIGNSYTGRTIRSFTTGSLASNKFDTGVSYRDQLKEQKDVKNVRKEIDRRKSMEKLNGGAVAAGSRGIGFSGTPDYTKYGDIMKTMSEKEILALDPKILSNREVAKNLKESQYEAIKKSDISDSDKKDIADARKDALKDAIQQGQTSALKHMMKEYKAEKFTDDLGEDELKSEAFVDQLTQSQLKKMQEEGLSADLQRAIAEKIIDISTRPGSKTHKAFGYIKKNNVDWNVSDYF